LVLEAMAVVAALVALQDHAVLQLQPLGLMPLEAVVAEQREAQMPLTLLLRVAVVLALVVAGLGTGYLAALGLDSRAVG
jgi:hypothetical protein